MAESRDQDPHPRRQDTRVEEQQPHQEEHETTPMSGFSKKILLRHDFAGSLARFWQSSYASDYIGLILLVVVWFLIQAFVTPFHRLFSLSDLHIHYPHALVERVPVWQLFLYGLGIPLICLAIWSSVFRPSIHKVHVTYLGLLISVFLSVFLTDFIKNGVGRPRPDLLDRCKPRAGTEKVDLVDWHVCTQTDAHKLHDGFRSFPSGHSSFSFAGLGFLSLFFAAQTRTLHPHASLPALLLTIAPLLGALSIAISRCEDYRHDVWDVTAGSLLGLVVAWLTYRRYYPNLRDRHCETPYPSPGEVMRRRLGSVKIDEESQRRRRRDNESSEAYEEDIRRNLLGRPSEGDGERQITTAFTSIPRLISPLPAAYSEDQETTQM